MNYQVSDRVKYIHKVLTEIDKIYYRQLKHVNMTNSEFVLLFSMLVSGDNCTQKDIADNAYISTKTLNSTVKKLEQKGLIELTPGKYPYRYINLTQKGTKYVQEKVIPLLEKENNVFENVSSDYFDKFVELTELYVKMFDVD